MSDNHAVVRIQEALMPAADAANAATQSPLQTHPLCRRYLVMHLLTLPIRVKQDSAVRDHVAWWALGVLADGQCELLDLWLEPTMGAVRWHQIFEGFKARGVEAIRFVACDELPGAGVALCATFPGATVLPLTDLAPIYALSRGVRRTVLWGVEAVQQMHSSLRRAAARHGYFADSAAAAVFLRQTLAHAERRLRVRPADLNENPAMRCAAGQGGTYDKQSVHVGLPH